MGLYGVSGSSFGLHTSYQQHRSNLAKSVARLASGDRLANLGDENFAEVSLSHRLRHKIKGAEASTTSLQTAQAFLDTTESYSQTVTEILQPMMELAARSSDGLSKDTDRQSLQDEFSHLQTEITDMTRQAGFHGKQTIRTEGLLTYDGNTQTMRFWQTTGDGASEISRDFSASALDASQNLIGFSATEDFTMSRDGQSLFFIGTVAGDPGGVVRVKRYDIATHTVTYGAELFATGDTLFVDEDGDLYANGSGTAYQVDRSSLGRTATLVTDLRSGHDFSVYDGSIIYSRSADEAIASTVIATNTQTALTGALTFGGGVDHAISSSGRFVADESAPGTIRVIDTRTSNSTTFVVGAGTALVDMQFSADGDRIYYINQDTQSLSYVNVSVDETDAVSITAGGKVVQGINSSSFNGLDLGGASHGSSISYVLSQDSTSLLRYGAIDLSLYQLRLANTRIDTETSATEAVAAIQIAQNRVAAQRAKTGAMASRFQFALQAHQGYIANTKVAYSGIRDVDFAKETTEFTSLQVLSQAAQATISQYNTLKMNVLRLLNT